METKKQTLVDMFNKAASVKHFPRITVPHQNGQIIFSLASKSKDHYFPNLIYIKFRCPEQSVDAYLGVISKQNVLSLNFRDSPRCDTRLLQETLRKLHVDPLESLSVVGQNFSYCCFCGTEITSKNSLAVGYGPICAEKFGLPWDGEADRIEAEKVGDL